VKVRNLQRVAPRTERLVAPWSSYLDSNPATGSSTGTPALSHASARCMVAHSRSQWSEDLLLLPLLLALPVNHRTFVELGAFNGVSLSNTLALERCFGWHGLLIEANPVSAQRLNASRCGSHGSSHGQLSNTCIHAGVCDPAGNISVTKWAQEISGSTDDMSEGYLQLWGRWNQAFNRKPSARSIVPCRPLAQLAREAALSHVGLLSIDVEGAEDRVLQTANLSVVSIVMVEADGLDPLKDARVNRHLLLSGFQPLPFTVHNSLLYRRADLLFNPGCELRASRSARGEDLMLLPSLLALQRVNGTFVEAEDVRNPLTNVLQACFGWRQADDQADSVAFLSVYNEGLNAHLDRLDRYSIIAVQGSAEALRVSGELLTNASARARAVSPFKAQIKKSRRMVMAGTAVWCKRTVDCLATDAFGAPKP